MNQRRSHWAKLVRRGSLPLALAALTAGCTTSHPAAKPTTTPSTHASATGRPASCADTKSPQAPPNPASIDRNDPSAVSCAVLELVWMLDTTTDSGDQTQHAGELRAAASPYVTADYAAQLRSQQPIPLPGGTWQTWTRHHAYISVRVSPGVEDGAPSDTATDAYRQWRLTTVPTGRDNWRGDPIEHIALANLTRTGPTGQWQVDGIRYND